MKTGIPAGNTSRKKKAVFAVLKGAVLVATVAVLMKMIDWGEFWLSLKKTSPLIFTLVVCLNLLAALVMALRWHSLILAAGFRITRRVAASYTLLGLFFNQIMPGSISGDAARIWCLGNRGNSLKKSAGTVLWDRVLGLSALIFLTLSFMPFYYDRVMGPGYALISWTALLLAMLFFLSLQSARLLGIIEKLAGRIWRRFAGGAYEEKAKRLFEGLRGFLTNRMLMGKAFFLSIVIRSLWLIGAWFISNSMGYDISLAYFFFFIPIIELIRMVPVSIQGLGVRELAFVFFLKPMGVDATHAALLSMLFFTALTISGVAAGLIYMGRKYWEGQDDGR